MVWRRSSDAIWGWLATRKQSRDGPLSTVSVTQGNHRPCSYRLNRFTARLRWADRAWTARKGMPVGLCRVCSQEGWRMGLSPPVPVLLPQGPAVVWPSQGCSGLGRPQGCFGCVLSPRSSPSSVLVSVTAPNPALGHWRHRTKVLACPSPSLCSWRQVSRHEPRAPCCPRVWEEASGPITGHQGPFPGWK